MFTIGYDITNFQFIMDNLDESIQGNKRKYISLI